MLKTQRLLIRCFLLVSAFGSGYPCFARPNIGFTVQKAWNTPDPQAFFTVATVFQSKIDWQYYEFGAACMPYFRQATITAIDNAKYHKVYDKSFYGLFGGYFVTIAPIFRPGILLGSFLTTKQTYSSIDGSSFSLTGYNPLQIDSFVAFEIQAGIFTFQVSNKGIGGGLNVHF